jgi:diguanylate cyclase (GGDEF)-like protein
MPQFEFTAESSGATTLKGSSPIVAALVSFLVLLLPCSVMVHYLIKEKEQAIAVEASNMLQALVTKLEGRLQANIAVGLGFEVQISVLGDLDQSGLEVLAKRSIDDDLNIRHVALAPNLVIRAIYPLQGNEAAVGLDYRKNEAQKQAALRTLSSNQVVLAGPLQLVQGGKKQLIARFPVFLANNDPWGVISLVIKAEELFADVGLYDAQNRYDIAMRGKDGLGEQGAVFFGDATLFQNKVKLQNIGIPGGSWQIAARPKNGWSAPGSTYITLCAQALALCLLGAYIVYALRQNAVEREAHVRHLESLSAIDPLTQLTSRYQFKRDLAQRVLESERDGTGFTVLFIDLDHFKEVNDGLGHSVGDELLVVVADRIQNRMQEGDLLSRLGGDEFVAVLQGVISTADIERRADAICQCIAQPVMISGLEVTITSSVGVALYPQDGGDGETLIRHADRAKFESKRSGRNSLYFFNASLRNEADRYIELTAAMKVGLAQNEFEVYYQPIYDLKQERFTRCEALCRWIRPEKGFVSPADFIPVAEQSGLILDLGAWLNGQVLSCYHEAKDLGISMNFSVNRSPQEFGSVRHTQSFIRLRQQRDVPPQSITLEITESLLMSDNRTKADNFQMLKNEGFNFSIDDFGTGYSAINYLRKYPVESLKIDKSFIAELGVSSQADVLVKVIIQMAKSLDIAVVAEGVETRQQLELLREMGCDYIQGYYFAKPMPKADFMAFIAEHSG